ncbi:hypothetical protein Glove_399g15 [Diversispora epigaea]|uniref:Protein kinase domain-containing protein n=1 Tax=Diversispora epigaea TaxID=1348612 RepID=A0A397H4M7_9GLOM|nr:hypothetical protein Glove_399g15 [Diversispora epigaea]
MSQERLNWNAKLIVAKQIVNVRTFLHSNNFIHGKLNIKFNVFGLTKIIPESLRVLTNILRPNQYIDSQYLEIFNAIGKNKSSDIFNLEIILWEISSCKLPFKMKSLSNFDSLNNIVKGKREMVYTELLLNTTKYIQKPSVTAGVFANPVYHFKILSHFSLDTNSEILDIMNL